MEKKQKIFGIIFPFLRTSFATGFWKIFPLIVFVWFISWVVGFLHSGIEMIFPQSIAVFTGLPEFVVKLLELITIVIVVLVVGIMANQKNINKKFGKWVAPVIYKIPVLGFLYGITNKVSFRNLTNLFKEAVYVETAPGIYERGFVTGDSSEDCCKALGKEKMKSVLVPFFPFTSARPLDVEPEKLTPMGVSVTEAITSIATINLSTSTQEANEKESEETIQENQKESHSESE
jgi:uncharacterized membrane protein